MRYNYIKFDLNLSLQLLDFLKVEVKGMINAHLKDSYAICEFYANMEDQISVQGNTNWTEISAAEYLSSLRFQQPGNRGLSFTTISASGSNAAVIHYTPDENTNSPINDTAIYLSKICLPKLYFYTQLRTLYFQLTLVDNTWMELLM